MRPAIFHPRAREVIRWFPQEVRDRLGKALFLLQMGERLGMPLSRPMPSVAPDVSELRLRSKEGESRVFYLAASSKGILIFHAFVKKTQKTPPSELDVARKRLKEVLNEESSGNGRLA